MPVREDIILLRSRVPRSESLLGCISPLASKNAKTANTELACQLMLLGFLGHAEAQTQFALVARIAGSLVGPA